MKLVHYLTATTAGLAVLASVGSAPASAVQFNFSFSNVQGGTAGTVQGIITLPNGDGTFAATGITVNSAPAALGYTTPYNVLTNMPSVIINSFTVVGGAINPSSSSFGAQNSTEAFTLNYSSFGSLLSIKGSASATSGVWDTSNTTLTYPSASGTGVPEPSDILGLIFLGGFLFKMSKKFKNQLTFNKG